MRLFIARCFVLAAACLVSACATQNDVSSTTHHSTEEGAVPGEKVSDETQLAPGTGTNPNASVRW
jgi:hypothetical protein